MKLAAVTALTLALVAAGPLAARMAAPTKLPVDRLIANLEEQVVADPASSKLRYTLGRVHCLAFAGEQLAQFYGDPKAPRLWNLQVNGYRATLPAGRDMTKELSHLKAAVEHFLEAARLDPNDASIRLGLAYALDVGADVAGRVDTAALFRLIEPVPDPALEVLARLSGDGELDRAERDAVIVDLRKEIDAAAWRLNCHRADDRPEIRRIAERLLTEYWLRRAQREYHAAFVRSIEEARTRKVRPGSLELQGSIVAYEAACAIRRLQEQHPDLSALTVKEREVVICAIDEIEAFADSGFISPIVFSLDGLRDLSALLDERRVARFDLDADGVVEPWSWPNAGTAILVWDPDRSGVVRDGTQLFGNRTWNLFFENGYEAMSLLDDDHDGWLRGEELVGLALWRDRDTNGLSDAGEVAPIESTGIHALECAATKVVDRMLGNARGLVLDGGRALPTYDWWSRQMPEPNP